MAYGCQSALDHALAKFERVGERIARLTNNDLKSGATSDERMLVHELALTVGYLLDAVHYLKDGVP